MVDPMLTTVRVGYEPSGFVTVRHGFSTYFFAHSLFSGLRYCAAFSHMVAFWHLLLFPMASVIVHDRILAVRATSQRSRTQLLLLIFRYVLAPGRSLAALAISQR